VPVVEWRADADELRALAVALVGIGGRHLDDASPVVDVRWEHGARVHAVLPPVACTGTAISIRLPQVDVPDLDELARRGLCDAETHRRLEKLVAARRNILVSGATGAGKTTLLSALLGLVPPHERIVTIEGVAELRVDHPHHVRLEARQPNLEGAGAVPLSRLVREALRMRPDRLVVGECRGEEVRELLTALNTGHDGGAGTLPICPLGSKRWALSPEWTIGRSRATSSARSVSWCTSSAVRTAFVAWSVSPGPGSTAMVGWKWRPCHEGCPG